ncbi:DUF1573 domain-containing protein [Flavobacterium sp.]|uniref:DUF1573 domain-containing protein n=1 Tax=Flavobacterium sp. TaxID=239 RepID=UPI003529332F
MKNLKLTLVALCVSVVSFAQTRPAKATIKPAPVKMEAQQAQQPQKKSQLTWDTETHDFGDIERGKPVTYEFTFTNTSKETILLTNVKPSCGCTAANYTKTPIKPGEKGYVSATYNAASPNAFNKAITVTTNEENVAPTRLMIKGTVLVPEKEEKSILLK